MNNIRYDNTRFDPDLTDFHDLAKLMAKSVGFTAELSVDGQLAQLLRLRVAQLNPCSYCLILHTQAAHDQGITPARISNLPSWRESKLYSKTESAALHYCENLTRFDLIEFPPSHDNLTELFSDKEIAEIAAIVINMNVWTRLKMAQGATPTFEDQVGT